MQLRWTGPINTLHDGTNPYLLTPAHLDDLLGPGRTHVADEIECEHAAERLRNAPRRVTEARAALAEAEADLEQLTAYR